MAEGTPKAIEIRGITRNATKIGVQDGQAEDLINLRFTDGSWRASGDGRLVHTMSGTIYQQLYVHTNIYHHLLGVYDGTLYWFAEIADNGVTFYPLDGTSDRSGWPEDKQDLPTEPVTLTTVVGDVWITQTGHLLTVIDESDNFEHFVFKTGEKEYVKVVVDVNGKTTDRSIYPFGQLHFNLFSSVSNNYIHEKEVNELDLSKDDVGGVSYYWNGEHDIHEGHLKSDGFFDEQNEKTVQKFYHNIMVELFGKATEKNQFTRPFLVLGAYKLYDGSYVYASNPVLLFPRELPTKQESYVDYVSGREPLFIIPELPSTNKTCYLYDNAFIFTYDKFYRDGAPEYDWRISGGRESGCFLSSAKRDWTHEEVHGTLKEKGDGAVHKTQSEWLPVYCNGVCGFISGTLHAGSKYKAAVIGSDLCCSIENTNLLSKNSDVFKSFCIFITPQVDIFPLEVDNTDGEIIINLRTLEDIDTGYYDSQLTISYSPKKQDNKYIASKLMKSQFYLLKEYSAQSINELTANPIVDISDEKYEGILTNIVQQDVLSTEATSRTYYLPKVVYQYNNRLHIANYKSYPFFGYPIDLFHLHNHSVKVQDGAWFPADADGQRVLPNLADNNNLFLQYSKTRHDFPSAIPSECTYFAFIDVTIDTAQGEQKVVRYIEPYAIGNGQNGRADFIESLNPLLTYPDARAKKIRIVIYSDTGYGNYIGEFNLKPHPYLNIAYYIDPDLKPIELSMGFSRPELPAMQNTEEYFPNGLKVSKADDPMFFPVQNTYQVGSSEILALMSNSIAVGTGQTGDAPLYVFCKDGVYALYVDSSGQMTYPNARILARDVCNNPRSVTPIDAGVVFTTDRGLMMIAGEQVQEIGAPAEGDVVQFWNAGSVDYSKIATASMQQIAGLPSELCSTTDFLTYLQDKGTSGKAAIINYNHNMRELMVSNPNYPYSYVLDRKGNWSRRDYTAAQYVNNYPTSYRVDDGGHFYKVDDEGDANTSLEHRKEADNKIFYLSNVIKLDSIGFKQAYRFVVRGFFRTKEIGKRYLADFATTPNDYFQGRGSILLTSNEALLGLEIGDCVYLRIGDVEQTVYVTDKDSNPSRITFSENLISFSRPGQMCFFYKQTTPAIACVVEGSYDGRKFKPLGYNRKSGKFRDIGCVVERTDVRFFRICLSGQVTGKTRIDYMEMSAGASMLNTKIR